MVAVVRYRIIRIHTRGIPRPSFIKPITIVAGRNRKVGHVLFGSEHPKHRSKETQALKSNQAFPTNGQTAFLTKPDKFVSSEQRAGNDSTGVNDGPSYIGIVSRSSVLALIIDMLFIGESKIESKAAT